MFPHMKIVTKHLKPFFFFNVVYVTCVGHGIHQISEKIIDPIHDIHISLMMENI